MVKITFHQLTAVHMFNNWLVNDFKNKMTLIDHFCIAFVLVRCFSDT